MSAPHSHSDAHASHGGLKPYAIGFVLAVLLTALPFGAVMKGMVSGVQAVELIMGTAVVQILVHLHFFLHIDRKTDRWTLQALFFTVFVLGVIVSGSLWVMFHLNHNMMPMMPIDG